ncbi:hypothetical protein [Burkholderia sp. Ac-20365]|uniref:hypothetical protein n=1 Tax=Burkholderia sp. Ac-20365 TaxID=2703897 RepID=UPI00197C9CA5|nr:hypothetical protein [Burkholderia sp. Ac-20365]MBN3761030.1 hypothetical protein [Burkholderia sp. Ac-20365]
MKILAPLIVAVSLLLPGFARGEELRAGIYALRTVPGADLDHRKVYVAVNGTEISGFFDNPFTTPAANNPDRDPTCRFLLKGSSAAGGVVEFTTFFGAERGASIAVTSRGRGAWSVHVDGDLPNCEVSTVESGDSMTFDSERHWLGFARIASAKAPLFNEPQADARSKAYLVRNDVVAILERHAGWAKIDYFQRGGNLVRWVNASDLAGR